MKRLLNILVSILFLLSIIGIQINTHYSKGELFSIGVFQEAQSCCDIEEFCEQSGESSCQHSQASKEDNSCENISSYFHLDQVFGSEPLNLPPVKSIESFAILDVYQISDYPFINSNKSFYYPLPPIIDTDNPQAFSGVFLC